MSRVFRDGSAGADCSDSFGSYDDLQLILGYSTAGIGG